MLYYICPMHTLWTGIVVLLHLPNPILSAPWQRYTVVILATTLVWHSRTLFDALFSWMGPLVLYENSMYEWWFRSKLDMYSALVGCLLAEARPYIEEHLNRHDSLPWVLGRAGVLSVVLGLYAYFALGMTDRVAYNAIHPYVVFIPLVAAILLRNSSAWLRARHSWLLGMIGRHSLELYLLQFDLWLGALAKGNVTPVPELRVTSGALQSLLFCATAVVVRHGSGVLLQFISSRRVMSIVGMVACFLALLLAPFLGPMGAAGSASVSVKGTPPPAGQAISTPPATAG